MLRYRVTLTFDQYVVAECMGDDLKLAVDAVLDQGKAYVDVIVSTVHQRAEVYNHVGQFRIEAFYQS